MGIENIMYFALGLLVAGLVALAVLPAVWRRAVRLTKKRIDAVLFFFLVVFLFFGLCFFGFCVCKMLDEIVETSLRSAVL